MENVVEYNNDFWYTSNNIVCDMRKALLTLTKEGFKMDKKKCFVIMPFSQTTVPHTEKYWTTFFGIVKDIMESHGYECIRSEVGPYKLFSNIVTNIESSDIVVAVLTDFNANVWYELGIRHTLKTGTIMLLQDGQKPPFDISDFGIIFYEDSIGLDKHINQEITKYLSKFNGTTCDSPVLYSLSGKTVNSVEKKLEEMQQLIWKIVEDMPKSNITQKVTGHKQNRVLWVDDYPINNELVMSLFADKQIAFDIAISTKQGIDLYKKKAYDVVITDMGRGNQSDAGIELIRELKALKCEVPIIVYASYSAIHRYGDVALALGAKRVTNGVGNIIAILSDILGINV